MRNFLVTGNSLLSSLLRHFLAFIYKCMYTPNGNPQMFLNAAATCLTPPSPVQKEQLEGTGDNKQPARKIQMCQVIKTGVEQHPQHIKSCIDIQMSKAKLSLALKEANALSCKSEISTNTINFLNFDPKMSKEVNV